MHLAAPLQVTWYQPLSGRTHDRIAQHSAARATHVQYATILYMPCAGATFAGLSSSEHWDWAAATSGRFRSWSAPVLQALLVWLQQHRQDINVVVQLLQSLTAWVRLGALHQVPYEAAMQAAQAGLLSIQSRNTQVRWKSGITLCAENAICLQCLVSLPYHNHNLRCPAAEPRPAAICHLAPHEKVLHTPAHTIANCA